MLLNDNLALITMKLCLLCTPVNVLISLSLGFLVSQVSLLPPCFIKLFSELNERCIFCVLTQGLTKNICSMERITSILLENLKIFSNILVYSLGSLCQEVSVWYIKTWKFCSYFYLFSLNILIAASLKNIFKGFLLYLL